MKRLIIICEGETEREFCESLLREDLYQVGIMISTPLIKKSMGGIVGWDGVRSQIVKHLYENAYVTTFIDYYGIKDRLGYPGWAESKTISDKCERINFLESKMRQDLDNHHFIPYLQLHEFEALLFNNMEAFSTVIPPSEFKDRLLLERVLEDYDNPELINDGAATCPSSRLQSMIIGYEKVLYGNLIAMEIGLPSMMAKCPHFRGWIERLRKL